jgi:hypothetical protein
MFEAQKLLVFCAGLRKLARLCEEYGKVQKLQFRAKGRISLKVLRGVALPFSWECNRMIPTQLAQIDSLRSLFTDW